jgi:Domain of unknown function (DUF4340)
MKELRRLTLHILLLVVAATAAFVKSRPQDEANRPLEPGEVELWGGNADSVSRVTFSGKRKVVTLERQKDDVTWYKGHVEPAASAPAAADAGADAGAKPPSNIKEESFVSITVASKLVKSLAPMRAKRTIGEVGDDRAEAFGLHEPAGTLSIEIGDKRHELVIGATAPGTGDRYVRYKKDSIVYVVDASIIRDLEGGAGRLSERLQHAFKTADVHKATVIAGDETRDVVRSGTEGRRFWADPKAPDVNAETVGNWLGKVERLRPIKYADALPEGATRVVRVEYRNKKERIGFVELYKHAGEKDAFYILTEQIRMPATVAKTVGEQVQDDLGSVLGGDGEDGAGGGDGAAGETGKAAAGGKSG